MKKRENDSEGWWAYLSAHEMPLASSPQGNYCNYIYITNWGHKGNST